MDEAQYHAMDITGQVADYTLDVSEDMSIERLMSTVGPAMRDMMQALDAYYAHSNPDRESDFRFFGQVFSRTDNVGVIHQFQSVVRLFQDPDAYHVPLYEASPHSGFSERASFESLSMLLTSLRRVRTVLRGNDEQKREYLQELMDTIQGFVLMMTRAPNHLVGEELRVHERPYYNPSITSPRSCRLSEDPVAQIERLTRELVDSLDFCRGLLFRFVPRETRDRWMDNFHELYDLFEQLLVGPQEYPIATHNVRLAWFDHHESMVGYLSSIQSIYGNEGSTDFPSGALHSIHSELERFLRGAEQRSSMMIRSLRGELDTMEMTIRDAVGRFLAAADFLLNGRQYLSREEAEHVTYSASVAFRCIDRTLQELTYSTTTTTPRPLEYSNTPVWASIHVFVPPRMEWTIAEVLGIIGYMNRESDMRSLLGPRVDQAAPHMRASDLIDDLFVTPAGLRFMMFYPEELVVVKFLQRYIRVYPGATLEIATEFPERMSQLVAHWESYSGSDSVQYLDVVLKVSDLARNPVMLSGLLSRVFRENDASRVRNLAHAILLSGAPICTWAELTEDATVAITEFWATHDDEVSIVLSRMVLSPVNTEYCETLRDARGVLDRISDQSLRNSATRYLLQKCPHLATLTERAQVIRGNWNRVQSVTADRDNILGGAVNWFEGMDDEGVRSGRIVVNFLGEYGSDAGGLRREWFYLVGREIVNGDNGILIETEPNSGRYIPNTIGVDRMMFVGKFIAKTIRDSQTVPIRFAKLIYRFILEGLDNVQLDLDMYTEQSPDHARALRWILEKDESSEGWEEATGELYFSVDIVELGVHRVHDLIADGSEIRVSQENKEEYVQRLIEFKMRDAFRPQLESFLAGFSAVLPHGDWVEKFTADELEVIIAGQAEVIVADLRTHTSYLGYIESDQQIVWFWEVIGDFDQTQLASLLQFTTGTPLAPVGGFARLPLKIARVGLHDNPANNPLPSAHTCSNQLDLPAYTSKEELRDKLVRSLTLGSEGFGFS
jgi:hypothetical protein